MFDNLQKHLDRWRYPLKEMSAERMTSIDPLALWIAGKEREKKPAKLIFVCTHNSRRSHMGQLWAQAAAYYVGLQQVQSYSGGTEETAFNPRAVRALQGHGFAISQSKKAADNIRYKTQLGESLPLVFGFSKKYDHPKNPQNGFAVVMVCTQADVQCPYVPGAELRVALPYVDPKNSDGTAEEELVYQEKSEEIGREMLRLMLRAAQHSGLAL